MSRCHDRMAGKVVVVTGATKGTGKAIAERVAAEGGNVVVASRDAAACSEFAATLNAQHGPNAPLAKRCDINVKDDLQALVVATIAHFAVSTAWSAAPAHRPGGGHRGKRRKRRWIINSNRSSRASSGSRT